MNEKQDFLNCIEYEFRAPFIFATDLGLDFPKQTLEEAKMYRVAELSKIWEQK